MKKITAIVFSFIALLALFSTTALSSGGGMNAESVTQTSITLLAGNGELSEPESNQPLNDVFLISDMSLEDVLLILNDLYVCGLFTCLPIAIYRYLIIKHRVSAKRAMRITGINGSFIIIMLSLAGLRGNFAVNNTILLCSLSSFLMLTKGKTRFKSASDRNVSAATDAQAQRANISRDYNDSHSLWKKTAYMLKIVGVWTCSLILYLSLPIVLGGEIGYFIGYFAGLAIFFGAYKLTRKLKNDTASRPSESYDPRTSSEKKVFVLKIIGVWIAAASVYFLFSYYFWICELKTGVLFSMVIFWGAYELAANIKCNSINKAQIRDLRANDKLVRIPIPQDENLYKDEKRNSSEA